MMENDEKVERVLRAAMPRVGEDAAPEHDLWPQLKARMEQGEGARESVGLPWFDWALLAALAVVVSVSPAALSMLFYCL